MKSNNDTRQQNGQDFKRAEQVNVGSVVWHIGWDPNVGRSWLEGPFFVVDIVHRGKLSEHVKIFSTHEKRELSARLDDLYVPIIDKIEPPPGHNQY